MERNRGGRPRYPGIITPGEQRVLEELRKGGTNVEIAIRLGLSPETVKTHIASMLSKLYLADRGQLAAWQPEREPVAVRLRGLLSLPVALAGLGRPALWVGGGVAGAAGVAAVVAAFVVVLGSTGDAQPGLEAGAGTAVVSSPQSTPTAEVTPQPTPSPTAASQPTPTPTPSPTPSTTPSPASTGPTAPASTPSIEERLFAFYDDIDAMPWVTDGTTTWEDRAVTALRSVAVQDLELGRTLFGLPWVIDGITALEASTLTGVRVAAFHAPDVATTLAGFRWFHDGISRTEALVVTSIRDLSRTNLPLARQLIGEPFLEDPFLQRDQYALSAVSALSAVQRADGSTVWDAVTGTSWFSDGLDDNDAALLHALTKAPTGFRQDLIESPFVEATTARLPLSGDVGLAVVRNSPFPASDGMLNLMEEVLRLLEDFVGAPLPVGDVTLLLVEPEYWTHDIGALLDWWAQGAGGAVPWYINALVVAENSPGGPSKESLYRALGLFYGARGPAWLREGTAEFLKAYVLSQRGGEGLSDRLAYLEFVEECSEAGIWEYSNNTLGSRCDAALGERFLLGMYSALGRGVVTESLKVLHSQWLVAADTNEDSIYYAFAENVPEGKEAVFTAAYRHYHGGPVVDRVTANLPDHAPLVALYGATNGKDWINSKNWLSDAPLGAWHGVSTNALGQVTELNLVRLGLVGEIPAELGDLANLEFLNLADNQLSGEVPPELGRLTNLKYLWGQGNQFSGCIAPDLPEMWVTATGLERCR